tara:strand:+ start:114 stop:419 length:306 start_codon:yes stop_codon:yes gene_type:complete
MKFLKAKKPKVWKLPQHYLSLTPNERREVRLQYIKEQRGYCTYCKMPLDKEPPKPYNLNLGLFPRGFLNHPVHLHHDHGTGLTIGAVHAYCNGVLWEYHGE